MPKKIDHLGQVFARLTVLAPVESSYKDAQWQCRCACGAIVIVAGCSLRSGATRSCGCLRREVAVKSNTRHSQIGTPAYRSWASMLARCRNPKSNDYFRYGGRGITVCERWKKFENFLFDMGTRPEGRSLDRINNEGNYEPSNCRWATVKEQNRNQRTNRMITVNGKTQCIGAFAEETGVDAETIRYRLNRGLPPDVAITSKKAILVK